jgi:hypothetical protein
MALSSRPSQHLTIITSMAVKDLETALSQVKTLKELLPICAQCKIIRDDQGC